MKIKLFEDLNNYYQITWEDNLKWDNENEYERMKQMEIDFIMKEFPVVKNTIQKIICNIYSYGT